MAQRPAVLVTGASSGIGLATATLLSEAGFDVLAGVRKPSGEDRKFREILLDVTREESILRARDEIAAHLSGAGLTALVNNAGVAEIGPLEYQSIDRFRGVFEVNVFGVLAVTQAFLPLLRQARGRIVNIGSVGGMITIPFGSALCASKHAIESLSDSLRMELQPSGISVTCLQPASINSGSAEKLAGQLEIVLDELPPHGRDEYEDRLRSFMKATLASETTGSPPQVVAAAVLDVLRSSRPPSRQLVGKHAHVLKFLARGIPDRWRDRLLSRIFFGG